MHSCQDSFQGSEYSWEISQISVVNNYKARELHLSLLLSFLQQPNVLKNSLGRNSEHWSDPYEKVHKKSHEFLGKIVAT